MKLSERIRPNVEAAPWVIEEVKRLEARVMELEAMLAATETTLAGSNNAWREIESRLATAEKVARQAEEIAEDALARLEGAAAEALRRAIKECEKTANPYLGLHRAAQRCIDRIRALIPKEAK